MKLTEQTAIVTGAARGLGLAIAKKLSQEGANIVLADILPLDDALAELGLADERVMPVKLDVTSDANAQQVVQDAIKRFGHVDILVNNAAIAANIKSGPFETLELEAWRQILEVNTIGMFIMCRAISSHFRARKYGRIVNIGSGAALIGVPGVMHYVASKGAVMAMSRSMATEFGSDFITVNVVSPGFIETEAALMVDIPGVREAAINGRAIKRPGHPDDIASAVFLMCSEETRFITGQTISVDGGAIFN